MKQILCNSCLTLQITLSKVLDVTLIKRHPKQLLNKSYVVVLIFCLLVLLFSQKKYWRTKKKHTHKKKDCTPQRGSGRELGRVILLFLSFLGFLGVFFCFLYVYIYNYI